MDPIPVSCEIDEGDFVGDDGLLRCGKCGAGKQVRVDWGGQTAIMPVMCRCQVEEADRLDAARRAAAHVRSVEGSPSHKLCLPLDPEYARHWEQMEEGGHGLVLIGPPGTGKTFAAGCLANFVMHDGKVPLVTSVSRAENVLWDAKGDERTRVLEGIRSYDLVVIDDLGAERDSSYMDSRAFDLVDACYRSGRPLVVTTNIPLAQLKHPRGLARTRIYDRVLERCQPVIFDGPSFRAAKAEENRAAVRRILDGVK